jgi:RHS repeat-associated protein
MSLQISNLQVQAGTPEQISFQITGLAGTNDNVLIQFELNGVARTATAAAGWGSTNPVPVAGAAAAQNYVFSWDAVTDLGTPRPAVAISASLVSDPAVVVTIQFPAPPTMTQLAVAPGEPPTLNFLLIYAASTPCALEVQYSANGGPWLAATPAGAPPANWLSSPVGTPGSFSWNAMTDLSPQPTTVGVRVRATTNGDVGAWATLTGLPFLAVMNTPPVIVYADQYYDAFGTNIRYTLSDHASQACSVVLEFSVVTTPPAPQPVWTPLLPLAGTQPTGVATTPAGTHNEFAWDTRTQFGNTRPYPTVQVRLTPSNPYLTGATYTIPVPFIPNSRVQVLNVAAGRGSPIPIQFTLEDVESDPTTISCFFSVDYGQTWAAATPAVGTPTIGLASSPVGTPQIFEWDALTDLAGAVHPMVIFRISPYDVAPGVDGSSRPFLVNFPPTCTITEVTPGDPTFIEFLIQDHEADVCSVAVAYSLDGITWKPATETTPGGATSHLLSAPPHNQHTFSWNARNDLGSNDVKNVRVSVVPSDLESGTPAISNPLEIDLTAHTPPALALTAVTPGAYRAFTVVGVTVTDADASPTFLELEYSLDGGQNWHPATVAAPSLAAAVATSAAGVHYDLQWDSWADLGEVLANGVMVQVTARDPHGRGAGVSSAFSVDARPTQPPVIQNLAANPVASVGPVLVSFDLVEPEGRDCTITAEFTINNGASWSAATAYNLSPLPALNARPASPTGVLQYFAWDVLTDLQAAGSGTLRLTPSTTRQGAPVSFNFAVASLPATQAPLPSISAAAASQAGTGAPVLITFTVIDASCRAVEITVQYVDSTGAVKYCTDLGAANGGSLAGLVATPAGVQAVFAWDCGTDLQGVPGTYSFLLTPQAFGDIGAALPVAALAVNANPIQPQLPRIVNPQAQPADRDGMVALRFGLSELASHPCDISAQWQDTASPGWKTATLVAPFTQQAASPVGAPTQVLWNGVADAGAGSFNAIQLSLIANNGQPSLAAPTPAFNARFLPPHPRALAAVGISVIAMNRREPVSLSVRLNDGYNEYSKMTLRYNLLGAADWHDATITQDLPMSALPNGESRGLQWDASGDLPNGTYAALRLEATPLDSTGRPGPAVRSNSFALEVWPLEALPPSAKDVLLIPGAAGDPVVIQVTVTDLESLACDLAPEYTLDDGTSWNRATLLDATTARGLAATPQGATFNLNWDVRTDLPDGNYPSVRARVTPKNGWTGAAAVSPPVALVVAPAAPQAPMVANLTAIGAANDEFQFSMNLVHPRSARATLQVLFSTDNGATWQTTTAGDGVDTYPPGGFDTAPAPGAPLSWWWNLEADLGPGASLPNGALLQVVAVAEGQAGSANLATGPLTTTAAPVGNPSLIGAPLVDPSIPDQVGIAVVVADPNSVPANVTLAFSSDGGTTWKPVTGVTASDTTGLATNPGGQEYVITWATRRDLAAQAWPNVMVQATCGASAQTSASFAIDLSGPVSTAPAISSATSSDWAPGLIAMNFVLTDDRSISCSLTVAFTCTEKPGWTTATEAVMSGDETYRWTSNASGIEHCWYWAARRDLGLGTWHNIQVQLTVSDGSQQAQTTVAVGDRTFTAIPPVTQLSGVLLENRDDSIRRRVEYSLNVTPPGAIELEYLLITPTATVPATVIGAPDEAFASDPVSLSLYWNANADVTAALDNQPLTLRVQASSGGTVVGTADLNATTDITDRSALASISAELETSPGGEVYTPVSIDFWVSDPLASADDLLVEYSRDGGATWLEATAWPGEGEGRQVFETSDGSTSGTFVWDIERDIPERYATNLQARVRLRSQPGILPGLTSLFDIDLGAPDGHTPTSFLTALDGSGPVVPIDVELYDGQGDLVNLVIEFFSPLSGTWVTATAADGSDLFDASPAQPDGTQYRFLWDAQADASQIFPPGSPPAGTVQMRATVRKARAASLADTHTFSVTIDASPYDTGLRDYPNIRPGALTVTGGTPQTTIGGQLLATPIALQLMDQTGNPIANAEVQLLVNSGSATGAEFVPVSVFTDSTGLANAQVRPADGTSGQLTLMAQVVGAPNCRLAAPVSITVDASTVVLQSQAPSFVVGNPQTLWFQFGSSDPNAGMSIAYGRPVELQITTDNGRISTSHVRLTNGIYPAGALPSFSVDVVPQTVGNIQISVTYARSTTPLFKQSYAVTAPPPATRTTGDTTTANAQVTLVAVSGDDPTQHADGARWPAAGSEQWGWPGLTLTTPFQVKLLIDGQGDGPSPPPPVVTGANVTGPPPDPPAPQPPPLTNCAGVTIGVESVGPLNQATATTRLQVSWSANGGTLSLSPTHSATDQSTLTADICAGVYFTPTTNGPWSLTANVSGLVLDPGRQFWIHTYTDASGQQQTEIHRGDALSVDVQWVFEIQQAPVFLVYDDANTTQADRISAGVTELVLTRVSPSTGTSSQNVAVNSVQNDGSAISNYTGPNAPPAFSNPSVPMTLQASGKELRSASFIFVRGLPANVTPAMLSFLRAAWVQVTALGPPLVLATDPPLRARLPLNGRPSVQDAVAGTTPFAGWNGTVSLSDCELVYQVGILEIVTAFGGMSLFRTWRGHLTWERRTWMNDDESRVLQWAGAFGPGWIGSFETELVPTPTDFRFMDASGRIMRLPAGIPANGLIARVVTNTSLDPDHAPIHLTFPNHGELRFHADGTLYQIVDARGHKTTFAYDQNSRLTNITDPHGHTVTFAPVQTAPNTQRVYTITDANQRVVTFEYQPSGALTVLGMLDNSSGPAALSSYGGSQQSFVENYTYLGATAATATLSPYAQVTLQEVFRPGESKVNIQHWPAGQVHTQTWNGGTVTFTPGTGTTRYLLIVFRDSSQQGLTFGGGGADAAGPILIQQYNKTAGLLRTSNYYCNSQGRLVRAEMPDNLVHRWTFDDQNPDIFSQGNLLAHEMAHTVAPAPPPPGSSAPAGAPVRYSRVESWEYTDAQNPASPTAAIPPESNTRRTQRMWRTDLSYTQYGEIGQVMGPSARSTRVALNGELAGPSPAPYTLDHKLDRPTTVIQYNNDGLVTSVQEPDGIVTQYAYYALNAFSSGAYSADGGGLVAQEVRDTTDNAARQFWYLGQPLASRQTLWTYDTFGHLTSTTDSRGCQHKIAANELGLPLRLETGIAAAGMAGTSVVRRTEYDAQWRPYKRILEQPGGTAEQGGAELHEVVTKYDNDDREISVTKTISASTTILTNVRRGIEGAMDGVCRPCLPTAQPQEILSVAQREERGLPVSSSLTFGRTNQTLAVSQGWDDHGAPTSVALHGTTVQSYRAGPFGTVGGTTDPRVGLTKDLMTGTDASGGRSRLTSTAPMATRATKRPAGTYGFGEERHNEWGLLRRVNRGLNVRPGTGSGAPSGITPDMPVDGMPGADPNFLGNVAADKNDTGFGPGDGRASEEIEHDILGRETLHQNDRTNTVQTCWSPDGVKLRERVGERNQLAWNNPLMPWRDLQWRWQAGTDWTTEVLRQSDAIGDPTQETTTLGAGMVAEERTFVNTYAFDSFGRVVSVTDPLGGTTRYTYDVHGEVATITDANGALDSTGTTNVDGNKTTWIRDGLGRVVRIQLDLWQGGIAGPSAVSAGSIQRTYSYTPEGQIATVADAGGFVTTRNYSPNGQLESVLTPTPRAYGPSETVKQTITYDNFGRPSMRTMPSGRTRTMNYNAAQQLERVDIKQGAFKGTLNYEYHPLGPIRSSQLLWVTKDLTPAGPQSFREVRTVEYDIDSNSRLNGEKQYGARRNTDTGVSETVEHEIQYTYDGDGLRTGLVYSDQQAFRVDLDRTGRILGVIRGKEETILRYEMLGDDFVRSRRSGVVSEDRDMDGAARLSSIQVSVNSNTRVQHIITTRDRCGRITGWTRTATVASGQVTETRSFTYDSAGRIVQETASYPTVGTRTLTRQYDGDNTLVQEQRTDTPVSGTATTRTKKSIRGGGGAIFETILNVNGTQSLLKTFYDLDGNVWDNGRLLMQHDALGRLIYAITGTGQTRYTYDANGRLVACVRLDTNDNETFREDFVWDGWRLTEVWRDGKLRERFVYGRGLNEIVRAEINGVAWFPVYGPDGSVDCILNDVGYVAESYAYDLDGVMTVFDDQRRPVSRMPMFRFGFHGHLYDAVNRLVYMRERWYSPDLAQFLEADPLGPAEVVSLYPLCDGDTINQMDPYGMLTWGQVLGIAAAVVIGTALTVATAGLAGPLVGAAAAGIIGGIVGGAVGGAIGGAVESLVDEGKVNWNTVANQAVMGAVMGGVFAGAAVGIGAIARTATAKAIGGRIAGSALTQAASKSAIAQGVRALGARAGRSLVIRGVGAGLRNLHEVSEGLGNRIASAITRRVAGDAAEVAAGQALPMGMSIHEYKALWGKLAAQERAEILQAAVGRSKSLMFKKVVATGAYFEGEEIRIAIAVSGPPGMAPPLEVQNAMFKHEFFRLSLAAGDAPFPELLENWVNHAEMKLLRFNPYAVAPGAAPCKNICGATLNVLQAAGKLEIIPTRALYMLDFGPHGFFMRPFLKPGAAPMFHALAR